MHIRHSRCNDIRLSPESTLNQLRIGRVQNVGDFLNNFVLDHHVVRPLIINTHDASYIVESLFEHILILVAKEITHYAKKLGVLGRCQLYHFMVARASKSGHTFRNVHQHFFILFVERKVFLEDLHQRKHLVGAQLFVLNGQVPCHPDKVLSIGPRCLVLDSLGDNLD